jgi:hypothetical protein
MQTLWQHIRYGVRMLFKQPGFSLIRIAALARVSMLFKPCAPNDRISNF